MVPISSRRCVAAVALVGVAAVLAGPASVNALPLFSDHTGPAELTVTEFERLDEGCADAVAGYAHSGIDDGTYVKTTFVETGVRGANLSAWVERTSPDGADLSTFRVHVDSHGGEPVDGSCTYGVQYRVEVTPSGGSPAGLLPDAHGIRITWVENGVVTTCQGSVTSPLELGCPLPTDESPERTWANATDASGAG